MGNGGRGSWIAGLFKRHGGYAMHAVADYFPNVAEACGEAVGVDKARRFSGLSGYRRLMESGVEAVALVVPPYFFRSRRARRSGRAARLYGQTGGGGCPRQFADPSRRAGRRRSGSGVFWWTTKCRPTRGISRCASRPRRGFWPDCPSGDGRDQRRFCRSAEDGDHREPPARADLGQ